MKIRYIRHFVVAICFLVLMSLIAMKLNQGDRNEFMGPARVVDGDTIVMDGERLRLAGLDAPEMHQLCHFDLTEWQCGLAARDQLQRLVNAGGLVCRAGRRDKYRRPLVVCHAGGIEINREMVLTGLAVDYGAYQVEAALARDAKLGLWASRFERPDIWRRQRGTMTGEDNPDTASGISRLWTFVAGLFGVRQSEQEVSQ